MSQQGKR